MAHKWVADSILWNFNLWLSTYGISTYGFRPMEFQPMAFDLWNFNLWLSTYGISTYGFRPVEFQPMDFDLWNFYLCNFNLWLSTYGILTYGFRPMEFQLWHSTWLLLQTMVSTSGSLEATTDRWLAPYDDSDIQVATNYICIICIFLRDRGAMVDGLVDLDFHYSPPDGTLPDQFLLGESIVLPDLWEL